MLIQKIWSEQIIKNLIKKSAFEIVWNSKNEHILLEEKE